jgi:hypothetical protein
MRKDRFHYCLPMEVVEWEFFGVDKRPSGMASAFSNPAYFKKRCKSFLNKIRRRVNEVVTNDETLRLMLIGDIDRLNKEFGQISGKNNNDIEIIAEFFIFVAHLLGWAHIDGRFYRTPIYYQSEKQREEDLNKSAQLNLPFGLYEAYKRRQIVKQLLSEGNSHSAVALIMGITASNVKSLENAQHIDEMYQKIMLRKEIKR